MTRRKQIYQRTGIPTICLKEELGIGRRIPFTPQFLVVTLVALSRILIAFFSLYRIEKRVYFADGSPYYKRYLNQTWRYYRGKKNIDPLEIAFLGKIAGVEIFQDPKTGELWSKREEERLFATSNANNMRQQVEYETELLKQEYNTQDVDYVSSRFYQYLLDNDRPR